MFSRDSLRKHICRSGGKVKIRAAPSILLGCDGCRKQCRSADSCVLGPLLAKTCKMALKPGYRLLCFEGEETVGVVREADSLQGDLFHYVALWLIRAPPRKGWRLWQTPFAISCLEKPRRSRKQRRSPQHRRKHERPASGRSSGCGSRKPRDGDNAKKGRHERRPDDRNGRDNFRLLHN